MLAAITSRIRILTQDISELKLAPPAAEDPKARDWSGFFAAIAELCKVLLPIILPLLSEKEKE